MQTRRDQLQAYRFQNRRALAALVTGQPNVLEPPMRRLTVTTLSGIMIAILIAIVFGILAIIRPTAGDSWKKAGAVIVDQDNGVTYVYVRHTLHPVLNRTSAVLAVSSTNAANEVKVDSSDISGASYGYEIGIPDVPLALPSPGSLVKYPMSVCSVQHTRGARGRVVRVSLRVPSTGGSTKVAADQGVLVTSPNSASDYLLYGGQRFEVASPSLGFAAQPVVVGSSFLNSVPQGIALKAPYIRGAKTASAPYRLGGRPVTIASVVHVQGSKQTYLAVKDGLDPLTPFQTLLFSGYPTVTVSQTDAAPHEKTSATDLSSLSGLPATTPPLNAEAAQRGGVCAVYDNAQDDPHFVLPSTHLPRFVAGRPSQTNAALGGAADSVDIPATKGVLAVPSTTGSPYLIISDQGVKYSFDKPGLIAGFGYSASEAVRIPPALLRLIPSGTGLSQAAALARAPR